MRAHGDTTYRIGKGWEVKGRMWAVRGPWQESSGVGSRIHTVSMNFDISPRTAKPRGSFVMGIVGLRKISPTTSTQRGLLLCRRPRSRHSSFPSALSQRSPPLRHRLSIQLHALGDNRIQRLHQMLGGKQGTGQHRPVLRADHRLQAGGGGALHSFPTSCDIASAPQAEPRAAPSLWQCIALCALSFRMTQWGRSIDRRECG